MDLKYNLYSRGEIILERQLEFYELGEKKGTVQMHLKNVRF